MRKIGFSNQNCSVGSGGAWVPLGCYTSQCQSGNIFSGKELLASTIITLSSPLVGLPCLYPFGDTFGPLDLAFQCYKLISEGPMVP